jgi:hypothetical protein
MTAVYFDPAVGGDGSTVTDDANPSTGLANGGHHARFVPSLAQVVAVAGYIVAKAYAAQNAASVILAAPGTSATSTSSMTISTGSKPFTLAQTGKSFVVGQWVSITDAVAPAANWMLGAITAFNSGTGAITVNVVAVNGTGTLTSWVIAAASPTSASGLGLVVVTGTTQTAVAGKNYAMTNVAATTVTGPASASAGMASSTRASATQPRR